MFFHTKIIIVFMFKSFCDINLGKLTSISIDLCFVKLYAKTDCIGEIEFHKIVKFTKIVEFHENGVIS